MIKVLLLVSIVFSIWYWRSILNRMPADKRRRFLWASAFWGVLLGSILLVATGKMHWIGAGLAALIPLSKGLLGLGLRAWPILRFLGRFKSEPSQFRTDNIFVEVNFSNQKIDGEVLKGDLSGRRLSDLTPQELTALADGLHAQDRESYLLLQAYMLRAGLGGPQHNDSSDDNSQQNFGELSENEALEILGLKPGTSDADVISSHRRLIQRLHPDRGGSDYLAAKINAAKDKLIS